MASKDFAINIQQSDDVIEQKKVFDLLPSHLKTSNQIQKFFDDAVDQWFKPESVENRNGYVGEVYGNASVEDVYLEERSEDRKNYQLTPSYASIDDSGTVISNLFYPDTVNYAKYLGSKFEDNERLFEGEFFTWSPPVNIDMLLNYNNYYWVANSSSVNINIYDPIEVIDDVNPISLLGSFYAYPNESTQSTKDANGDVYSVDYSNVPVSENDIVVFNSVVETSLYESGVPYQITLSETGTIEDISDARTNFRVNVLGEQYHTLPNGLELKNGHRITILYDINEELNGNSYIINGVGTAIEFLDSNYNPQDEIYADEIIPEYIVMERGAVDGNMWSRTNQWFHLDIINESVVNSSAYVQATQPIIEYFRDIKLVNFGSASRGEVDFSIDVDGSDLTLLPRNFTRELNEGRVDPKYTVGSTVLFRSVDGAPSDPLLDRLFRIERQPLNDGTADDYYFLNVIINGASTNGYPVQGETVLVKETVDSDTFVPYHWDDFSWVMGQRKGSVNGGHNQYLYFEMLDPETEYIIIEEDNSTPSINGSTILQFQQAAPDIGYMLDIEYNEYGNEIFEITSESRYDIVPYFKYNGSDTFDTTWVNATDTTKQPIVNIFESETYKGDKDVSLYLRTFELPFTLDKDEVVLYINEQPVSPSSFDLGGEVESAVISDAGVGYNNSEIVYFNTDRDYTGLIIRITGVNSLDGSVTDFQIINNGNGYVELSNVTASTSNGSGSGLELSIQSTINEQSIVINDDYAITETDTIVTETEANGRTEIGDGYFKLPLNLINNPLGDSVSSISVNEIFDHIVTIIISQDNFDGDAFGINNYNNSPKDNTLGTQVIKHENSMIPLMLHASDSQYDIVDSLNYNKVEYIRFYNRFLAKLTEKFNTSKLLVSDGAEQHIMDILESFNVSKTEDFAFWFTGVAFENSCIPPTPSFLGILPTFEPKSQIDYILGHDGVMIPKFNDELDDDNLIYNRDQIILALENMIFDSINDKFKNDAYIPELNIYSIRDGSNRNSEYSRSEYIDLSTVAFEEYAVLEEIEYKDHTVTSDWKTWNWTSVQDLEGINIANWREHFFKYYDTDTPNVTPWHMLGFSIEPTWWSEEYPNYKDYSTFDVDMWTDIKLGNIKRGLRAGIDARFTRPLIVVGTDYTNSSFIPYDSTGTLLSPSEIGIVPNDPSITDRLALWNIGDLGEVEYAYKTGIGSSFDTARTLFLTKPTRWASHNWYTNGVSIEDQVSSRFIYDKIINISKNTVYPANVDHVGYSWWVSEYLIGKNISTDQYQTLISGSAVKIGYKLGGFSTEQDVTFVSDNFGLVPQENTYISMYRSNVIERPAYSGINIVKRSGKYEVYGFDSQLGLYLYFKPVFQGKRTSIDVGNKTFIKHLQFETETSELPYKTRFGSRQEVYEFIRGYGEYLDSAGWIFEDTIGSSVLDWDLMAENFLIWSSDAHTEGDYVNLSCALNSIKYNTEHGSVQDVAQNIGGSWAVLDQDYNGLRSSDFDTYRIGSIFGLRFEEVNNDRFNLVKLNVREYEHCVIFDNLTQFNNIIYEPVFGIRQERLKLYTTRTADWNGRLDAGGYVVLEEKTLPNFEKLTNDFRKYYDHTDPTTSVTLSGLANQLIGYRTRDYIKELVVETKPQIDIYKGFMKDKGTFNAFNNTLRSTKYISTSDFVVNEEWAFKTAQYGGYDNTKIIELVMKPNEFTQSTQVITFGSTKTYVNSIFYDNTDVKWLSKTDLDRNLSFGNEGQPYNIDTDRFNLPLIYDSVTDYTESYFNIWKPHADVIPSRADREIEYRTSINPAIYGGDSEDDGQNIIYPIGWTDSHIGELWWNKENLSYIVDSVDNVSADQQIKFLRDNWGSLNTGEIEILEWVKSPVLPLFWTDHADQQSNLNKKTTDWIPSGEPVLIEDLNGNERYWVVSTDELETNGIDIKTWYYFWVKNPTTIPDVDFRKVSANEVKNIVANPSTQNIPWICPIYDDANGTSTFIINGHQELVKDENKVLQLKFTSTVLKDDPKHTEWTLVRNEYDTQIDDHLWNVLRESLLGYATQSQESYSGTEIHNIADPSEIDEILVPVPDPALNGKFKYGNSVAIPYQSMFINLSESRRMLIDIINDYYSSITIISDLEKIPLLESITTDDGTVIELEGVYWDRIDWYAEGVTDNDIRFRVSTTDERDAIEDIKLGDIVYVDGSTDTGWLLYQYSVESEQYFWNTVGSEQSTLELNNKIVEDTIDAENRDVLNGETELVISNILETLIDIQTRIFVNMTEYALHEQKVVDWAFKTSYMYVTGLSETLVQRPVSTIPEIDLLFEYFDEVKPYRSKLRASVDQKSSEIEVASLDIYDSNQKSMTMLYDFVSTKPESYEYVYDESGYITYNVDETKDAYGLYPHNNPVERTPLFEDSEFFNAERLMMYGKEFDNYISGDFNFDRDERAWLFKSEYFGENNVYIPHDDLNEDGIIDDSDIHLPYETQEFDWHNNAPAFHIRMLSFANRLKSSNTDLSDDEIGKRLGYYYKGYNVDSTPDVMPITEDGTTFDVVYSGDDLILDDPTVAYNVIVNDIGFVTETYENAQQTIINIDGFIKETNKMHVFYVDPLEVYSPVYVAWYYIHIVVDATITTRKYVEFDRVHNGVDVYECISSFTNIGDLLTNVARFEYLGKLPFESDSSSDVDAICVPKPSNRSTHSMVSISIFNYDYFYDKTVTQDFSDDFSDNATMQVLTVGQGDVVGTNTLVGGNNYPTDGTVRLVCFGGTGIGLEVDATVTSGSITAVSIAEAGSGYTHEDSIIVIGSGYTDNNNTPDNPDDDTVFPADNATFVVEVTNNKGAILTVELVKIGNGYTTGTSTVGIHSQYGIGATFNITADAEGAVSASVVATAGSGYVVDDIVSLYNYKSSKDRLINDTRSEDIEIDGESFRSSEKVFNKTDSTDQKADVSVREGLQIKIFHSDHSLYLNNQSTTSPSEFPINFLGYDFHHGMEPATLRTISENMNKFVYESYLGTANIDTILQKRNIVGCDRLGIRITTLPVSIVSELDKVFNEIDTYILGNGVVEDNERYVYDVVHYNLQLILDEIIGLDWSQNILNAHIDGFVIQLDAYKVDLQQTITTYMPYATTMNTNVGTYIDTARGLFVTTATRNVLLGLSHEMNQYFVNLNIERTVQNFNHLTAKNQQQQYDINGVVTSSSLIDSTFVSTAPDNVRFFNTFDATRSFLTFQLTDTRKDGVKVTLESIIVEVDREDERRELAIVDGFDNNDIIEVVYHTGTYYLPQDLIEGDFDPLNATPTVPVIPALLAINVKVSYGINQYHADSMYNNISDDIYISLLNEDGSWSNYYLVSSEFSDIHDFLLYTTSGASSTFDYGKDATLNSETEEYDYHLLVQTYLTSKLQYISYGTSFDDNNGVEDATDNKLYDDYVIETSDLGTDVTISLDDVVDLITPPSDPVYYVIAETDTSDLGTDEQSSIETTTETYLVAGTKPNDTASIQLGFRMFLTDDQQWSTRRISDASITQLTEPLNALIDYDPADINFSATIDSSGVIYDPNSSIGYTNVGLISAAPATIPTDGYVGIVYGAPIATPDLAYIPFGTFTMLPGDVIFWDPDTSAWRLDRIEISVSNLNAVTSGINEPGYVWVNNECIRYKSIIADATGTGGKLLHLKRGVHNTPIRELYETDGDITSVHNGNISECPPSVIFNHRPTRTDINRAVRGEVETFIDSFVIDSNWSGRDSDNEIRDPLVEFLQAQQVTDVKQVINKD